MTRNKILIADDEESMRNIGEATINDSFPDFKTETFKDGNSLVSRLTQEHGDVNTVITDNLMGKDSLTGGDIILKYARNPEYKDVKFILCYGGHPMLGEAALSAGAYAIINKGSETFSEDYIKVVRSALEKK